MEWKDRVKQNPYLKKLIIDGEEKIVEIREVDENIIENGTPLNAENMQGLDDSKVSKSGDTMTGSLVLADSSYLDGIDNEGNRLHLIRTFNNKVNIGQGDKVIYFDTNADIEYWKNGEVYTIASTKYVDNKFKQKILWQDTGGSYMSAGQTAQLSERISEQNNGIVLLFQPYRNESPQSWGWYTHFFPKGIIQFMGEGYGQTLTIPDNDYGIQAGKYIYFYDDHLAGNDQNIGTSTMFGQTIDNKNVVLTAVIGV